MCIINLSTLSCSKTCYHCTMQVVIATGQQRWWWRLLMMMMMAESLASYLSTLCRLDTSVRMETWCLCLCCVIVSTLWSWSGCICICSISLTYRCRQCHIVGLYTGLRTWIWDKGTRKENKMFTQRKSYHIRQKR